ncbi:transposase [Anabaena azotica]|uniref:transposase n=1 Tax=Anabaena azotica TaxID=197653 RepID=UPI0039A4A3FE
MDFKDVFALNHLRCEIAFQKALQLWQSEPKLFGVGCPHCGSLNFKKYSFELGKQRYICKDCQRRFTERPRFECSCIIPGKSTNCHTCPRFQEFLATMCQYVDELRELSVEELQSLTRQ